MQIITYYAGKKTWCAYLVDKNDDQIGNAEFASTKENACFWLGIQYANLRSKQNEETK